MRLNALAVAMCVGLVSAQAAAMTPKEIYKKAGPAVVLILGSDGGSTGSGGTGSIVTAEGKVLTNAHVVLNEQNQPYKTLYVFLKPPKVTGDNGKDLVNRYRARVLSYSVADELDLAILQIENPPPNLPTIAFGDPDEVEVGDEAIAIGHPEQAGLWTLTVGTISTVIANFNRINGKHVFQTDASVNRGNSGGPLLDAQGNLVGINTMIARQGAGGIAITGVNFSLKSSVAVTWLAGQGMGLAYAPKGVEQPMVVAVAPEPQKPAATGSAPSTGSSATSGAVASTGTSGNTATTSTTGSTATTTVAATEPATVAEPPPATIVLAEPPPKPADLQKVKDEGQTIGKQKGSEKVVQGKPLDPKKAAPKYETEKRPFSLEDLRKKQMKEMEDMMDEMKGKVDKKKAGGKGMGLW